MVVENDLEQPSSPSVKKSEEKGVVVVHEVKCKLYVKVFASEKWNVNGSIFSIKLINSSESHSIFR